MRGFQASRVLLSGVELNVFSALEPDGATAAGVAKRLGCDTRATAALLNALTALKLLIKQDDLYRNTADTARYLTDSSPDGERIASMHTVNLWNYWSTLTDCVREGTSTGRRGGEGRDADWTEAFIEAMARNSRERAPHVVRGVGAESVSRMLDVGGGPATYAIAFAQANPELRADVMDLPEVLGITRRHIDAAGLAGRISAIEGDLTRDEFGGGYDLVLVSNICHMLSSEQNLDLLSRCRNSLEPGGRVVIQDFILDEDRAGPPSAALFAINMLVATEHGSSYSERDYTEWLAEAGFADVQRVEMPGPTDLILAAKAGSGR